jgi:hypothetical protein
MEVNFILVITRLVIYASFAVSSFLEGLAVPYKNGYQYIEAEIDL